MLVTLDTSKMNGAPGDSGENSHSKHLSAAYLKQICIVSDSTSFQILMLFLGISKTMSLKQSTNNELIYGVQTILSFVSRVQGREGSL